MILWLALNMAWASAFMLLILALRAPFARLLGAGPAYALWLVPVLRLILPPMPGMPSPMPHFVAGETLVVFVGDTAAPLPPDGGPGQWVPLLLAIWAGGAVVFLAWQFLSYRRFLAELGQSARQVGLHRGLPLIESAAVDGPVALGLVHRRIVVPADFESRYSAGERRLALDHEAVHHRRFDLWWNHLGLVILAANWFNPIAWLAFRAFRADQELACDARVTASASAEARHDYACALIKSASRPGLIAACPLNHADQLKRRLKMMKSHRPSRGRMLAGAGAILGLAGLSLAFGTPGLAQTDSNTTTTTTTTTPGGAGDSTSSGHHVQRIIIRTDGDGHTTTTTTNGATTERVIVRTTRTGHGAADAEATAGAEAHHDGTAADGSSQHVFVMTTRDEADHPGAVHQFQLVRNGNQIITPDCNNGHADEVNEGTEGNHTRVILCSSGNMTPAQRADRLQHVRDQMAADSDLSDAQKAHVLAALDRQIAQLRGH